MNATQPLDIGGRVIASANLKISRAQQFVAYLAKVGPEVFAHLLESRVISDEVEAVIFRVEVQRPQHPVHDIRREELLAAHFLATDYTYPQIFSLRVDFPLVPHINLLNEEFPRNLCLYDQPWENVRLNWTPAQFLSRIRYWLAQTALGTLHADDQPLEPLLQVSSAKIVLPSDFSLSASPTDTRLLDIFKAQNSPPGEHTLLAFSNNASSAGDPHSVAVVMHCPPQPHGIIRRQPQNLKDLHEICLAAGMDLAKELAARIQAWHLSKPQPNILKAKMVLILVLPKSRHAGEKSETTETRAFFTLRSVAEVGEALDVIQAHGGQSAYVIGGAAVQLDKIAGISVGMLQVIHSLSADSAAFMNGVDAFKGRIFAIGAGALGSQVFNNLIRSGFGKWGLADPDVFLPHNGARHYLGAWAVGQYKVSCMGDMANTILDDQPVTAVIPADILKPGKYEEAIQKEFDSAEFVLDFSASVSVSRHLAAKDNKARNISAFMNPRGNCLVIAAEDKDRGIRLDWLEMLHYRAVLNEPLLLNTLQAPEGRLRYGNGCRDVSTQLAQDDTAVGAAVASKAIKRLVKDEKASLSIYLNKADGEIQLFTPKISPLISVKWYDWTVRFDEELHNKLIAQRKARLPNETGGILLGHFDTFNRLCSIIDLIPSPPDSVEWPTSYIRGSNGLAAKVESVETQTLGQIGYVGEWHSHPDRTSTNPSEDDLKAYAWLIGHMNLETLPAIMMIVGDRRRIALVTTEA